MERSHVEPPLKRAITIEGRRIENALGAGQHALQAEKHGTRPHYNEITNLPGEPAQELLRTVNEKLRPEPFIGNGELPP